MPTKKNLNFYDKKLRPWINQRLERAAIIGHTTHNQTKIWVRMKDEGDFVLLVSKTSFIDKNILMPECNINHLKNNKCSATIISYDNNPKRKALHAKYPMSLNYKNNDNSCIVNITNLKENKRYYYAVAKVNCLDATDLLWEIGHEQDCSFKTMELNPKEFSFGLYSCHMPYAQGIFYDKVDAHLWSSFSTELARDNASFVIGAGDQVYTDGNKNVDIWKWLEKVRDFNPTDEDMISWYRDIYRGYWGFPKLQEVYRSFPNYMIWDDHEIMDGWGSYTDKELSQKLDTVFRWENVEANTALANRMFLAAKKVYFEYQHSHNPKTDEDVYDYSFNGCGADFFTLDMRSNRSPTSILGGNQFIRLQEWCEYLINKDSHMPIFIVSPVPVVHLKDFAMNFLDWAVLFGARDDVTDHWEHNNHFDEFEKFLDLTFSFANELNRPLIFLSGDVHVGLIGKITSKKYPKVKAFQVTSSGITYAQLNGVSRKALEAAAKKEGFLKNNDQYKFTREWIYAENNFAIIRIKQDGKNLTEVEVSINGSSKNEEALQIHRINLLSL